METFEIEIKVLTSFISHLSLYDVNKKNNEEPWIGFTQF